MATRMSFNRLYARVLADNTREEGQELGLDEEKLLRTHYESKRVQEKNRIRNNQQYHLAYHMAMANG